MSDSEDSKVTTLVLLTMGQERQYILGEYVEENATELTLFHPMVMDISYHGKEGMRVAIYDYMPFADGKLVSLIKANIHAASLPTNGIGEYYLKYRQQVVDDKLDQYLETQITGGPMPDDIVTDFDESPASEHDTKH